MKKLIFLGLTAMMFVMACEEDNPTVPAENDFAFGKNRYTTEVDGDIREYYVHVPSGYGENNPSPLVFMLHGASGRGEGTYNYSGWKEMGEQENFLTVFPTAWSYCWIKASGEVWDTTRWNSLPGIFEFCDGETPRDDVKFLRQVVAELNQRFNVDAKRVYMVGFSSGAQMTYRCAVEMSDLLAAVVESGATHQVDTVFTPLRKLPMSLELGNMDETWFESGYPPLSLFDTLLSSSPLFQRIVNAHVKTFGFEAEYTMSESGNVSKTATYKGIHNADREFNFSLIDGLDHSYPNGVNHQMYGADQHWQWMKQYSLP